jgi:DNA-directed RNA polymerase specialized sigma24 family protein
MTHEAFAEAYESGVRRTVGFLLSWGAARDLAPDVAQWAWMHGFERLELLRNDSSVVSWVNSIAWNHYRRLRHSRRAEEPLTERCGGATEIDWAAVDIGRILGACSESDRALFEARLMGHTTDEIAGQLGITGTAVRLRLLRARRAVRRMLRLEGKELESSLPMAA